MEGYDKQLKALVGREVMFLLRDMIVTLWLGAGTDFSSDVTSCFHLSGESSASTHL